MIHRRHSGSAAGTRRRFRRAARLGMCGRHSFSSLLCPSLPAFSLRSPQSINAPNSSRAMTIRWISLVPSPISQIFASRIMRSTG